MDRRDRNLKWWDRLDERRQTAFVSVDWDVEQEIPIRWEVCGTCEGKGSHVNPGIDAHGLSREDFDEDPDFAEDYFSGRYDVQCNECDGRRVVPVPDEERATKEQIEAVESLIQDRIDMENEYEAERRMGA